ncbi:MAG: UbiD family decarboxylase, partial [Armatimonadota bacterium]|nr:UbiD family decarboxylase [Armatimonadota bacterium]
MVLEGIVPPFEREMEGPFGDHFGHYSHAAPFPVFHLQRVVRRRSPVYPAAVVGKPPQEDRYLGDAVQEMLIPLLRLLSPELRDLWAYYEAGFHNLAVAAVESRYPREALKTALGLLGQGQMSLTKCIVLVDPEVNVRDFRAVLRAIRENFDPPEDFILISRSTLDTLDFTSFRMHLGSKLILDATGRNGQRRHHVPPRIPDLRDLDPRILRWALWEDTLLAVQVRAGGREMIERLVKAEGLEGVPWIVVVSPDVDVTDQESLIWGIFTRFDPARDIVFEHVELRGVWPVCHGRMGIDATWKEGYPKPLEMTPEIQERVRLRWKEYFPEE